MNSMEGIYVKLGEFFNRGNWSILGGLRESFSEKVTFRFGSERC